MCGAVQYELEGESEWTGYCHCHSCRKHTGAPVVASSTRVTSLRLYRARAVS